MRRVLAILALLVASNVAAAFDFDPFYDHITFSNGTEFIAVRPFYSRSTEPDREREIRDYLWPIYTRKSFKEEQYSRFLFCGYTTDFSEGDERHRIWLIPFFFKGVDSQGESYFAFFPFGGTIHEFMGRDEIMFVLFPLYAKSHINEVNTTSVLWPIYSRSKGDKVDRLRFWPLYGWSDLVGEFRKKFVLWPIYTSVNYTNTRNPGGGFILFPLYGRIKTEHAVTHWYLPPFFRFTKSEDQNLTLAPWPFIQLADGDIEKTYFWPLYGRKHVGIHTKRFFLWPFIWNNETEYSEHTKHRRLLAPIFAYESNVVTTPNEDYEIGDVSSRYWKLWPLMSWERKHNQSRYRLLELWPLRNTPGVERNWAPYWTLYRRVNDDGEIGHHLLWGLYRQSKSTDGFEWSLLKGLAGYKQTETSCRYRLLFMWFGGED